MKLLYKNRTGQVLVEYLLLMVMAIGCAAILTKGLINRNANQPGIIINAWNKILVNIGRDVPDCVKPDCGP